MCCIRSPPILKRKKSTSNLSRCFPISSVFIIDRHFRIYSMTLKNLIDICVILRLLRLLWWHRISSLRIYTSLRRYSISRLRHHIPIIHLCMHIHLLFMIIDHTGIRQQIVNSAVFFLCKDQQISQVHNHSGQKSADAFPVKYLKECHFPVFRTDDPKLKKLFTKGCPCIIRQQCKIQYRQQIADDICYGILKNEIPHQYVIRTV